MDEMAYVQNMKKNELYCFLIDDDEDDRDYFASAIKNLDNNIRLDSASSGTEAIQTLQRRKNNPPHYIFLDLNMSPMDGKQCLTELKKIPHLAETPVIIYSTHLNEKIIYETLQIGAFDHIEKPTNKQGLLNYLKRLLQIAE
jgi:CheY-like chemotaxis protein